MLRSTLSTGFLHDPQSGGSPGPAAYSAKPDVDGHRACRMTHGECACHHSPVAGRSWPSAVPPPGALTATEVRGRVIWLNPSITCSRHLGGIRRRRTQSAAEVQGNSPNLPRANRRSPSAARATVMISTPPSQAVGLGRGSPPVRRASRPHRRDMISAASSVDWPLAGARGSSASRRHLSGCAPARMLVIEACPAWSVTSSCGACGCVLA